MSKGVHVVGVATSLVVACLLFVTGTVSAQTSGTWTANANGNWSTTSNWAGGTVADGAGALADFGTVDLTAGRTITLDSNRTIGQLIFGDAIWTNSGFDWTLQSGTLTLDNTGGTGGNPASITVLNRTTTISSVLAGSDGLSLALPWSNYDTTRGTANSSGNGGVSQTSGGLTFSGSNTLSGTLSVTGGTVRVGGAAGRFGSVTALSVTGNGSFLNGDATAASNNGITNRVGDGTATLSLGGLSGAGTFTSAFAASDNTTSQTFASLTINAGRNVLNTVNTAAGTNNLIFTGAGGAGYVRNTNGLVNVVPATGFNPQFTNAPTAAGGSTVAGSGSDAILTGAVLNGNDFIAAASGNLAAATYDTTLTAGKNVNVTGALATSGNLSINSLRFGENAARTLTIGASDTLTLASGGILTGSAVATSGNTITGGSITSSQGDLWIYASGSGLSNPRVGGNALTIASKITGAMSVTVGGGQQVVFGNSANDYTGGTFFTGGILSVGSDGALGAASGTVTAVGGTNYLAPSANFTFNADRNFVVNSGAALFIGDRGATTTIAGQLSGGGQFGPGFVSNGQRVILTGNNSGFTGQYMVNGRLQAAEGTSLSSNANLLFTGRAGFGGGVLETSGTFTRSLGSGAGQVQWQNDGQYGSGGFAAVGGALTVNIGGNVTADTLTWGSGYFLPNGGQELVLGGVAFQNPIALNGGSRRIVVPTATVTTLSGVLSGNASSGINKLSTGTLVLTGSNTYAGKTLISAGTLSASSLNSVSGGNASSSLGAPTTAANGTITIGATNQLGTLLYTGTGETTDRTIQIGTNSSTPSAPAASDTGSAMIQNDGTTGALIFSAANFNTATNAATGVGANRTLTLAGSNTGANTIQGVIQNNIVSGAATGTATVGLTKSGTGTWTLSGSNTYTGTTTVSAGTLQIGSGGTTGGLSSSSAISVASGATLAFNRSDDYGGSFANTISGSGGIMLLSGSLTFSNAKTYNGATSISGGTLALASLGSFANSSAIIVGNAGSAGAVLDLTAKTPAFSLGAGQLLGGGGTVRLASSGTVNVLGTFSPGNSAGLFTYDGGTTILSGTTVMEILGTSRATGPSHATGFYDAVNVATNATLQLGGLLTLDFANEFGSNTVFDLFTPDAGSFLTGNFSGVNVIGGFYTGLGWNEAGGVWKSSNTAGGQSLEFSSATGQLVIVPEPGAIALAGIGIGLAGWIAYRRRR
jgi:autotransporter-associated beta strand protein